MIKLLKKLKYIRQSGRVDWEEIKFDTIVLIFLGAIFWVLINGGI